MLSPSQGRAKHIATLGEIMIPFLVAHRCTACGANNEILLGALAIAVLQLEKNRRVTTLLCLLCDLCQSRLFALLKHSPVVFCCVLSGPASVVANEVDVFGILDLLDAA